MPRRDIIAYAVSAAILIGYAAYYFLGEPACPAGSEPVFRRTWHCEAPALQ